MGSEDVGGSTKTKPPQWWTDAAKYAVNQGRKTAEIGYVPYAGPDVAAFNPQQVSAMQDASNWFGAFNTPGQAPVDVASSLMPATDFGGGLRGYSSYGGYQDALANLKTAYPGLYSYINSFFPHTQQPGQPVFPGDPGSGDPAGPGGGGGGTTPPPVIPPPVTPPPVTPPPTGQGAGGWFKGTIVERNGMRYRKDPTTGRLTLIGPIGQGANTGSGFGQPQGNLGFGNVGNLGNLRGNMGGIMGNDPGPDYGSRFGSGLY